MSCCRNRARSGSGTGSARFFFTTSPQSRGLTAHVEVSLLFTFSSVNVVSLNTVGSFSLTGVAEVVLFRLVAENKSGVLFKVDESVLFENDNVSISSSVTSGIGMLSDALPLDAASIL